jgi:hypothetical protein
MEGRPAVGETVKRSFIHYHVQGIKRKGYDVTYSLEQHRVKFV